MSEPTRIYAQIKAASRGDIDALRLLSRKYSEGNADWGATFEALVYARLAYAHTGEQIDAGLFVSQLALAINKAERDNLPDLAAVLYAEALAVVDLQADKGIAIADKALTQLVDHATPKIVNMAKQFRQIMTDEA